MNIKLRNTLFCLLALFTYSSYSQDYTINLDANDEIGYADSLFFGTNLVHERNVLDSSFRNNMDNLKMQTLRYPGGTVTEYLFDIGYAADFSPLSDSILNEDEQKLKEFLDYCKTENIEPILVVPTKPYVKDLYCNYTNCDSQNGTYTGALSDSIAIGASKVAEFVRRVNKSNRYGDHYVKYWEIGNEYYTTNAAGPSLTTWRYKTLAVAFANAMVAVDDSIFPLVHHKRKDTEAIDEIADYLNDSIGSPSEPRGKNIKGVVTHVYPSMPKEDFGTLTERLSEVDNVISQINGQISYSRNKFNLDSYITEWNIGSKGFPGGMIAANIFTSLFEQIVIGDPVFTAQWPISWKEDFVASRLANRNGTLTPSGQVWNWLTTYGMERNMVSSSVISTLDTMSIKPITFVSDDELTILIMCRQGKEDGSVRINVDGFDMAQVTSAQRITRSDPTVSNDLSEGTVKNISPTLNTSNNYLNVTINKDNEWEIIRITCSGIKTSAPAFLENIGTKKKMKSTSTDDDVFLKGLADPGAKGKWKFEEVGNGYYFIINEVNNMRLRGRNSLIGDTSSVHLVDDTYSGAWLQWELTKVDSTYYIDNVGHNLRLLGNAEGIAFGAISLTDSSTKWQRNFYTQPNARLDGSDKLNLIAEAPLENDFFVYPNPAKSKITVDYHLAIPGKVKIKVFDMLGKLVLTPIESELGSGQHQSTVDLSSTKSGLLLIEITSLMEDGEISRYVRKIIRE